LVNGVTVQHHGENLLRGGSSWAAPKRSFCTGRGADCDLHGKPHVEYQAM